MPKKEATGSPPLDVEPDALSAEITDAETVSPPVEETPPAEPPKTKDETTEPENSDAEAPESDKDSSEVEPKPDAKKPGIGLKIKAALALWWANKKLRNLTLAAIAL